MKEAVIFIPGFDAKYQNYFLDTFLTPGLLTQLEEIDIKLDPQEVKIPGQTGKRFHCQLEDSEKTIDIYEVYWDDLIDRLSSQDVMNKFVRGLIMIIYWFGRCWKIMQISRAFFWESTMILFMVLFWYVGIIVLVIPELLSKIGPEGSSNNFTGVRDILPTLPGWVWVCWSIVSLFLLITPYFITLSINLVTDFAEFLSNYLKQYSGQFFWGLGRKPPTI
jgi:hypothetical protein